jgi:hypothetical protein
MSALILLPLCLIAGFVMKRTGVFPAQGAQALNSFIIWIAFPAVVLVMLPEMMRTLTFSRELLVPMLAVWFAFAIAALAIFLVARARGWNRATTGALVLTAGLGNTSFVGFPLIEALHGQEGLKYALIVDQVGSFLVLSTLGLLVASLCSGQRLRAGVVARRILFFPPFVATLFALVAAPYYSALLPSLQKLAGTLVPLALFSVACQLHFEPALLRRRWLELSLGLSLKLIWIPALAAVVLLGRAGLAGKITVLELGMGPMITAAIVASEFDLSPDLANLMVGVGTPLSVLTVWLWDLLL